MRNRGQEDMAGKLVVQNRFLRVVSGACKAALIEVLQAGTMMPPTQEYFDFLQAKSRAQFRTEGQSPFITRQCKQMVENLQKRGTSTIPDAPGRRKDHWVSLYCGKRGAFRAAKK